MTITGKLGHVRSIDKTTFLGEFETRPSPISYGQGGLQQPDSFALEVTAINEPSSKSVNLTSYVLHLSVKQSKTGNVFNASFGFPYACSMGSYDYGYGYAGSMHEVPEEILYFISDLVGINLLRIAYESKQLADQRTNKAV